MSYKAAMPISVRLPTRVEQKLAEYCVSHRVTRSEAVKRALERMLEASATEQSPFDLGREYFERNLRTAPTRDVARHSKRLLIERTRGGRR
jgi:Arc/MetJ-type ribon-helix-helix transcriptional regulator